jgi:hypothetical protein
MIRRSLVVVLILLWTSFSSFSQDMKKEGRIPKGQFTFAPGAELLYRSYEKGSFLGDTYGMGLGFRLKMDFEFSGYPGIGLYFGTQKASIQTNPFLGGFFREVRMPETGIYIYHQVPISEKLALRGELGYGQQQVIHGLSPSRFILDYAHFSGGLVANYTVAKEVLGIFDLNLVFGGNYGFLNGNKIVINDLDRTYVQRATAVQGIFGVRVRYL